MPNQIGKLNELPPSTCGEIVDSIMQLNKLGKPQSDEELQKRIDQFFEFCRTSQVRPGIETLSLALGVNRSTFFRWCRGEGASPERQAICETARNACIAFLEQAHMSGKLNPASGIFLLKNWAGYRDTISLEENSATERIAKKTLGVDELPSLASTDE